MGQAKSRKAASKGRFTELDQELRKFGIDTRKFGFYDEAEFLAQEARDGDFLEKYGEWVNLRPFDEEYAERVRDVVPRLNKIGPFGICGIRL